MMTMWEPAVCHVLYRKIGPSWKRNERERGGPIREDVDSKPTGTALDMFAHHHAENGERDEEDGLVGGREHGILQRQLLSGGRAAAA